jgi:hypothetical protein
MGPGPRALGTQTGCFLVAPGKAFINDGPAGAAFFRYAMSDGPRRQRSKRWIYTIMTCLPLPRG